MARDHTGQVQPAIDLEEHRAVNGVNAKAVIPYGQTAANANTLPLKVSDNGDGTGTLVTQGSSSSVVVSSNNTTTTPLTAGSTYTGTATDISAYNQVNVEIYARPSTIQGDGSNAKASLFIEFSPDGTNWDISIPTLIRDPGLVIPIPLINVGKYFRLRYINDGGTAAVAILAPPGETASTAVAQTSFRLTTQLLPNATKELTRTLDQSISGSDPVGVVRAALMGRNPSNVVTNIPASGLSMSNNTTSLLTAGSTYTGSWEDRTGYSGISVLVKASHVSASNGLTIEYSDTAAGTLIRATDTFTFDTAALANGYMFVTSALKSQYFRVKYQNGGTNQTLFYLETNLLTSPTEQQQQQIEAQLNSETDGVITRSVLNAKNAAGTYDNVERGTSGGLDVGIVQYEVETPIQSLTSFKVTRVDVTTTAATVFTPSANCRSWTAKAITSSGKVIYVAENDAKATTASGFPLQNAEWVGGDLSSGALHASCDSGTQSLAIFEVIL